MSISLLVSLPMLFVAPGVGHVLTAERPSLFNQAMLQFLRSSEAGRG